VYEENCAPDGSGQGRGGVAGVDGRTEYRRGRSDGCGIGDALEKKNFFIYGISVKYVIVIMVKSSFT
jgi:hypothetical protein